MALLSGNHRKNRCFWRRSPIFLNLGWYSYILGSKWIAFPIPWQVYLPYIYIHGWMVWVLCKFPCDLFARGFSGSWGCGILGGASTPAPMCRVAIFFASQNFDHQRRCQVAKLPWISKRHGVWSPSLLSPSNYSRTRSFCGSFHMCCWPDVLRVFFWEIVYLWELTGLAGKSPPFNRKYICIHGGYSRL